jgi:hypothetical protein
MIDWKEERKTWREKKSEVISDIKETIQGISDQAKKNKKKSVKKGQKKCK